MLQFQPLSLLLFDQVALAEHWQLVQPGHSFGILDTKPGDILKKKPTPHYVYILYLT
jgi:hypothetical protein